MLNNSLWKVMSNNNKPSPLAPRHTNRLTDTHLNKENEYLFYTYCRGETQSPPTENRCPLSPSFRRKIKRQQQDENLSQISLLMRLSAKTNTSTTTDNAELGTCINKVNAVTWVSAALQSGTGLVGRNNYGWMMTKLNLLFTLWALTQELRGLNENP